MNLFEKSNEMDAYSVAEVALSNKREVEFFVDVDAYNSIEKSMSDLFADIRENKRKPN